MAAVPPPLSPASILFFTAPLARLMQLVFPVFWSTSLSLPPLVPRLRGLNASPAGATTCILYWPAAKPPNAYLPLPSVLVVASTLSAQLSKRTVTPGIPASPVS